MGYDFRNGHVTKVGGDREYKGRNDRELRRREDATDSEFWIAVCFAGRDACERFKDIVGCVGSCVDGGRARRLLPRPCAPKRQFAKVIGGVPTPRTDGALDGLEYTGDLQADAVLEVTAIARYIGFGDEVPYVCVWFENRADREAFVAEYNLGALGDKYVDGDAWMEELEARIGGTPLRRQAQGVPAGIQRGQL